MFAKGGFVHPPLRRNIESYIKRKVQVLEKFSRQGKSFRASPLLLAILILLGMLLVACGDSTVTTAPTTTAVSTVAKTTVASGATTATTTTTVAATTAATTKAASGEKTKILFASLTGDSPLYVAIDKGYFDAYNLSVEIVNVNNSSEIISLLATGQASGGGTSWAASFFNAASKGSNITIAAPYQKVPKTGKTNARLLVAKSAYDSGQVKTVADLKGKNVAIPGPSAFAEYSVFLALKNAGLSIKDVNLVNIPFPQVAAALKSGSVVAAYAGEPTSTQLEADGIAVTLSDGHAAGTEISSLAFNTDFLNKNPDAVVKFVAAYIKAANELNAGGFQNPQIQKIVEKYTKIPGEILGKIPQPSPSYDGSFDISSVKLQEAYYRERGVLSYSGDLNLDTIIRKDILEKALKLL
ncbi:ABC transporter substrate-binding protein [Candidatus Chlorohelix sp.]|uniref:ABC transporter substrate-binding protein n=1 Tax=Candidatus Chlorohelix sp. TaxID=3139201 RepID=UPI003065B858